MKNFLKSHKRIVLFSVVILIIVIVFTTAGISSVQVKKTNKTDGVSTCSIPEGKIIAHGIDVSKYQGSIDFEKVKTDGYSFVILRVGTSRGGKDSNFETYYNDAEKAGLDIGCYYYTYADTAADAKKEAKEVLGYIKGKSFNYPVFFDFEYSELMQYSRVDENTNMINNFCDTIKQGGYYPGVYTSYSVYKNYFDSRVLGNKWDFWVASYVDNTYKSDKYSRSFSMWQYTSNGGVNGINARVDLDVAYVDYPKIIKEFKNLFI